MKCGGAAAARRRHFCRHSASKLKQVSRPSAGREEFDVRKMAGKKIFRSSRAKKPLTSQFKISRQNNLLRAISSASRHIFKISYRIPT